MKRCIYLRGATIFPASAEGCLIWFGLEILISQELVWIVLSCLGGSTGGMPPRFSGSSICLSEVLCGVGLSVLVQAVVESATPSAKDAMSFLEG